MKSLIDKVIIIIIVVLETLGFSQTDDNYQFRNEILNDINYQRELTGLNDLVLSFELCQVAEIRAAEIADTWSHDRPDGSKVDALLTDFNWKYVGENLAKCYSGTDSQCNYIGMDRIGFTLSELTWYKILTMRYWDL